MTRATVNKEGPMDQAEGNQVQDSTQMVNTQTLQEAPSEKMLKQSEVNELVGRIKHEAYTKGLREGGSSQPSINTGIGGMPGITEDHVRQMIAEEAQKQNQLAAAHNLLQNFASQMGTGKDKYSDFDETVANLGDLKNISHVVQLASDTGMAGDVMYELGKNPGKVATLTTLTYVNPHLAKVEMKKLADSIKLNQDASKAPDINEPLSQIKPSTVGADSGSNSVRDLRSRPWARA